MSFFMPRHVRLGVYACGISLGLIALAFLHFQTFTTVDSSTEIHRLGLEVHALTQGVSIAEVSRSDALSGRDSVAPRSNCSRCDIDDCTRHMGRLEAQIDAGHGRDVFAQYACYSALARPQLREALQASTSDGWPSMARRSQLESAFCASNDPLLAVEQGRAETPGAKHAIWSRIYKELVGRMLNPEDCKRFWKYSANKPAWNPKIWRWLDDTKGVKRACETQWKSLMSSPRWASWHSKAVLWEPIGQSAKLTLSARDAETMTVSAKATQVATVLEAWSVAANMDVCSLDRLVEFGGGTAQVARNLVDCGYRGEHFIFDLLPMIIMQRYFLRLSCVAAALALDQAHPANTPGVVTLTSELDVLSALLAKSPSGTTRSLFYATWSLSETPKELRDKVLEAVKDHVTDFFFAFPTPDNATPMRIRDTVNLLGNRHCDNDSSLEEGHSRWIKGGNLAYFFRATFCEGKFGTANRSGCLWMPSAAFKPSIGKLETYYLATSAVDQVRCDPAAGCNKETLIMHW